MATASEEASSAPAASEPLKYQTWVLKVSVHCQGCKRKVKKVLQSIEGVYTASVDLQQQKVIVTGNVDPEILIRKLQKAGRHAEPWPEKPKKEKENGNKENTPNSGGGGKDTKGGGKPKEKDPGAGDGGETKPAEESSMAIASAAAKNADAPSKAAGSAGTEKAPGLKGGGGGRETTKAAEGKDDGGSPSPHEKPAASGGGGGGGAEGDQAGGGGGGKKGKKGQKEGGGFGSGEEPSASPVDAAAMYPHFPLMYPQTVPVYSASYSTAYPSGRYGAVYYAAPPVALPQQSHVHAARQHQQHQQQHQQYTAYHYLPPAGVFIPPSDEEGSYDVFSDENANACCVM